jgi:hypothetical protein
MYVLVGVAIPLTPAGPLVHSLTPSLSSSHSDTTCRQQHTQSKPLLVQHDQGPSE